MGLEGRAILSILSRSVSVLRYSSPRNTDPVGWKSKLQYLRSLSNKIQKTKFVPWLSQFLSVHDCRWFNIDILNILKQKYN